MILNIILATIGIACINFGAITVARNEQEIVLAIILELIGGLIIGISSVRRD